MHFYNNLHTLFFSNSTEEFLQVETGYHMTSVIMAMRGVNINTHTKCARIINANRMFKGGEADL